MYFEGTLISDHRTFRQWLRIFLYLLVLTGFVFYGKQYNPTVTLQMCLQNPHQYDGILLNVGGEAKVAAVSEGRFTIEQLGKRIEVVGFHPEIKPDEFVMLEAVFHQEGWLELRRVYVAVFRRYKIYVSLLPLVIVFILFLRSFRFDCRRMFFYERHLWRT